MSLKSDPARKKQKKHLQKCLKCGSACCRYLTVSIPTPRSKLDFNNLLWQLYHRDITAFKDDDGWYLLINTPCKHLKSDGRCGTYQTRPVTCRDYSVNNCEYGSTIEEIATLYFGTAESLEMYCRKRYKRWDSWLQKQ